MAGWSGKAAQAGAAWHRQWRRRRNLRAGGKLPVRAELRWVSLAACALALGGALLLAGHARYLGNSVKSPVQSEDGAPEHDGLHALQAVAPGARFRVPGDTAATVSHHGPAAIVVLRGMKGQQAVHLNLCRQLQGGKVLAPVRVGSSFSELSGSNLRNARMQHVVLGPKDAVIPRFVIRGSAQGSLAPLSVAIGKDASQAEWVSDTGGTSFAREGWLVWQQGAVQVKRQAHRDCKSLGALAIRYFSRADDAGSQARVTAMSAAGRSATIFLPAGQYEVPTVARASLEDQALFRQLLAHGLVRLGTSGLAELAPRDLAAWQASADTGRAGELEGWPILADNVEAFQLFKRLYRMADGAYVREQVRVFNNERRLLAWRARPALAQARWDAAVGEAPAAIAQSLPLAASRLFAQVPEGWLPWQRVAAWPGRADASRVRLDLHLPQGTPRRIELLLVGRVLAVQGGRLAAQPRGACDGRACREPGAVQQVVIDAEVGARSMSLTVAPLEMDALADGGAQQYRHLHVAQGQLAWRRLSANSATVRRYEPAGVMLHDRHGTLLWSGGAPETAAVKAGLGPLLGLRADHGNSVAGMLARLPAPDGQPHSARLTLDLALQQAAHAALDCMGLRQGRWDGGSCHGAQAVPAGRQAGLVVIDTASGDVLAAAGAGGAKISESNWQEVRDFDRANPDRSPLRLPALQHDGGAHRSPGSTFKIISALGLELAAESDPQLGALLAGMPLAAINTLAQRKGFAFQTAAASYPLDTRQPRITNYRDQHLDRRAQHGRLGLSQALAYSLNTWFAWSGELSDRSLFGRAEGGVPGLQALAPAALDTVRPIVAMAHRVGFERPVRLDGGLLPDGFRWQQWDALQASEARIDPIHTRHELRQMAIGLRMQATPLHMAMVSAAVGEGKVPAPRLLLELDGRAARDAERGALDVRLDRVRAGMKGVVDEGTAASAFRGAALDTVRRGLSGKTGTSPTIVTSPDGTRRELATVWFTGWLEPGSIPGERRRLALAVFVSHSEGTGGGDAAPIVAALLASMQARNAEQRGK